MTTVIGGALASVAMKNRIPLLACLGILAAVVVVWIVIGTTDRGAGSSKAAPPPRVGAVDPRDAEIERLRRQVQEAEADVEQLLAAVKRGGAEARVDPPSGDPISRAEGFRRLSRGVELAMAGKHAEAFDVYRALFEAKSEDTTTATMNGVLSRMKELGAVYAPAREALQQWRDRALAQAMETSADKRSAITAVLLNKALDDGKTTIALYHALPDGDLRRQGVAVVGFDDFVQARHYQAVVEAKPLGAMLSELDAGMARADRGPAGLRTHVIGMVALNIEALVGTGRMADAELLKNRLLAADKSPATLVLIETHLQRGRRAPGG